MNQGSGVVSKQSESILVRSPKEIIEHFKKTCITQMINADNAHAFLMKFEIKFCATQQSLNDQVLRGSAMQQLKSACGELDSAWTTSLHAPRARKWHSRALHAEKTDQAERLLDRHLWCNTWNCDSRARRCIEMQEWLQCRALCAAPFTSLQNLRTTFHYIKNLSGRRPCHRHSWNTMATRNEWINTEINKYIREQTDRGSSCKYHHKMKLRPKSW